MPWKYQSCRYFWLWHLLLHNFLAYDVLKVRPKKCQYLSFSEWDSFLFIVFGTVFHFIILVVSFLLSLLLVFRWHLDFPYSFKCWCLNFRFMYHRRVWLMVSIRNIFLGLVLLFIILKAWDWLQLTRTQWRYLCLTWCFHLLLFL